jgi:hypothetical protein
MAITTVRLQQQHELCVEHVTTMKLGSNLTEWCVVVCTHVFTTPTKQGVQGGRAASIAVLTVESLSVQLQQWAGVFMIMMGGPFQSKHGCSHLEASLAR